jgi:hypothetical protein
MLYNVLGTHRLQLPLLLNLTPTSISFKVILLQVTFYNQEVQRLSYSRSSFLRPDRSRQK